MKGHPPSAAWNRVASAFRTVTGKTIVAGGDTSCPVPGHGEGRGDKDPSLSVTMGYDGRVLLHCKAGCAIDDVLAALDLSWWDLFNTPAGPTSTCGSTQVPKSPRTQGNVGRTAERATTSEEDQETEMDAHLAVHAAGRIAVDVDEPPMPPGASEPVLMVLRFYALCIALRRWADMPEPYEVRFSRYWVAKHTGLHEQTVKRAIHALRRPVHPLASEGLLVFVRETAPRRDRNQARGTHVFAPGWLVDAASKVPRNRARFSQRARAASKLTTQVGPALTSASQSQSTPPWARQ